LNDLFYRFRIAHLNARYYAQVRDELESRDQAIQISIAATTGIAFAVLGVSEFVPTAQVWIVKLVALIASIIAFLVSAVAPWLGLTSKMNEARVAAFAWGSAAQQLDKALRFVKYAPKGDLQVAAWMHTSDAAYQTAAALPVAQDQDNARVDKLFREIEAQFPSDYVWTSL
jgi:hypothetical protein